ncbi:MAG: hypothetical protein IJS86_08385 [Lachnospiraceae bacterium]|nr:hypothetical protein [Lachnospiraceae bacterium]
MDPIIPHPPVISTDLFYYPKKTFSKDMTKRKDRAKNIPAKIISAFRIQGRHDAMAR